MTEARSTTDILTWVAMGYPDARILTVEGGYVLRRPNQGDLRVEDAEFDQLAAQSYIEPVETMPSTAFHISADGLRAVASRCSSWHRVVIPADVAEPEVGKLMSALTNAKLEAGLPPDAIIYVDEASADDKIYYLSPSASRLLICLGTWNTRATPVQEPELGRLKRVEL